ncbi:MAG: tetratricopeptide repeat protein [Bacteroidales bacterium]|nr:tetratricopeptide repeat protein [Bacteroidales bacterium]
MRKFSYIYSILLVSLIISGGCSVKKNTSATRAFHNLTARYNILFNGTESYNKGMMNLQKSFQDNYSEILPIFIYSDKNQLASINSDMDRAISKAMKLISMHSITAKPEIKENKELSPKQREFYNQKEYNKWVDEAYLLMAKAHFHKQEFDKATETFQYIITNYANNNNTIEARIWLVRLAMEAKKFKEAEEAIASLEKEIGLSNKNKFDLYTTKAELSSRKSDTGNTISNLQKSLEFTSERYYKQRYNYILAQIFQKNNQPQDALKHFTETIKLNPPYEMTFNARINMALAYESGTGSRKDIEKQLQKMLRDDKNIDYQDQIYFAWGNLYFKSGEKEKAIEYYKKSATLGKNNTSQLARTFLTIADYYYELPEYLQAQAFYDSATSVIDASYPGYQLIYAKSLSLSNLVENINTVKLQDSVQALAKKPRPEIMATIDKIIEDERKAEQELKRLEEEKRQEESFARQQSFEIQTSKQSSFYFYNPTAVNLGRQDFKRKWGNRKLEDNWRRTNKNTMSLELPMAEETQTADDKSGTAAGKGQTGNKYSREYYLQNIPFTDSALARSHEKIEFALFEMGNIYFNELKDYEKATGAYTSLIGRYPKSTNELQAYYKLYSIGKIKQNIDMLATYKQKIVKEYPQSNYAKVLGDPDYFKKIDAEEKKYKQLYAETYSLFNQRQFARAAQISKKALADYPEDELAPQFSYILTVSEGISKDTAEFINDLQKLSAKYTNTDIAESSLLLAAYLQKASPTAAYVQKVTEAKELYSLNPQEEHFAVIGISKSSNSNQMMFNITNFNIDNYSKNDLKVLKSDISQKWLLAVTTFANSKAAFDYLEKARADNELWRDVNRQGSELFIISKTNFELLKTENKLEPYLVFFKENYR